MASSYWTRLIFPFPALTTVDAVFNELGYNQISEFLNLHFFKTDLFQQWYYYEEGQDFIFPWSLEFRLIGNLLYLGDFFKDPWEAIPAGFPSMEPLPLAKAPPVVSAMEPVTPNGAK